MMALNLTSNKFEDIYMSSSSSGRGASTQNIVYQQQQTQSSNNFGERSSVQGHQQQNYGRESIHSGQFMISHFEAEAEAQEDDGDSEIKMPDPDDPNFVVTENEDDVPSEISTTAAISPNSVVVSVSSASDGVVIDDVNLCRTVQRYVPQKLMLSKQQGVEDGHGGTFIVTTRLEIETSLTKLFKCMSLAYTQKLTSPKWNHFKGIKLRWKDKIRLNNVIWRCWHMQFILKKKTPVCQFASPLDADIHINPQAIVLEGKYWKRQLSVIKAEYRKWRRNFKLSITGGSISGSADNRSDFDFLEWSPTTNENLMATEDWTSDTLFSAINGPFPFPDSREIARGAGIADFIQPSLGPLQPNFEDIDLNTFQELLQGARLPPVPEEVTEELLKSADYNLSSIMGPEEMDTANVIGIDSGSAVQQNQMMDIMPMDEANLLYLTAAAPYQQQANKSSFGLQQSLPSISAPNDSSSVTMMNRSVFSADTAATSASNFMPVAQDSQQLQIVQGQQHFSGKNILKGRILKSSTRSFKREPHNYDRAQPTSHQTIVYQQMLAEQQKQQHQLPVQQKSAEQLRDQLLTQAHFPQQYQQNASNAANFKSFPTQLSPNSKIGGGSTSTLMNIAAAHAIAPLQQHQIKSFSLPTNQMQATNAVQQQHSELLTILGVGSQQQQRQTFKTSPVQTNPLGLPPVTGFTSYPGPDVAYNLLMQQQQQQQQHASAIKSKNPLLSEVQIQPKPPQITKEIFRSNSLPLNATLPIIEPTKEDRFAVPKLHLKATHNRSRSKSNSLHQHLPRPLQTANSEPLLNSTLAKLLTANNLSPSVASKYSASTTNLQSLPPSGLNSAASSFTNTQNTLSSPFPIGRTARNDVSPTRTASLPVTSAASKVFTGIKQISAPPALSSDPNLPTTDQDSPLSPGARYPRDSQRRVGHIHAEQKRRYNIKNGFDMLHSLIPQLQQNPNTKLSKAAMLQKGAEYIKQLRGERNIVNEKMETLRRERDTLNNSLTNLYTILPASGAPISRQRTERVKQLYNRYIQYRTMENWKFWILGLILEPLLSSYTTTVSMASIEELYRTSLLWVDQHCSLVDLRPAVSNKLRYLSTTTDVLSDPPSTLQEEVLRAVNNTTGQHPNLNCS